MLGTIQELLYLTHDKWKDKVEVAHRDFFFDYLMKICENEASAERKLEIIIEYGQGGDRLVIMKGVINILKNAFPETHKIIMTEYYADNKKKKLAEELIKRFEDE